MPDEKCDVNNFLGSRYNSLVHSFDKQCSIRWQMHYFDVGMKVIHGWGVAWSIVEQRNNVE